MSRDEAPSEDGVTRRVPPPDPRAGSRAMAHLRVGRARGGPAGQLRLRSQSAGDQQRDEGGHRGGRAGEPLCVLRATPGGPVSGGREEVTAPVGAQCPNRPQVYCRQWMLCSVAPRWSMEQAHGLFADGAHCIGGCAVSAGLPPGSASRAHSLPHLKALAILS